ncbi:MAG: chitobiase/beta-hexosaminidase C-terminal domain-containing protein, partial [Phycisphaerae bacterium]
MARSMWARWIGWAAWAVCWVWPMMGAWTPPARAAADCGCAPCDFDLDGDVDLDDYAQLQNCLSGFGIPQNNPACLKARLDGDTDVDVQDVAVFKSCLTGANVPYPGTNLPVVAINEFVASNGSGLTDEDGNHPDWIELYVPCAASIDLGGWFLTDDPDDLQKWSFPPTVLNRGDYLVVFASGNDRRVSGQPLHTNFQIDKDGGFLALVRPDGQTIEHGYQPSYPQQVRDVAFGLSQFTTQPIVPRAVASYRVPTAADEGLGDAWTDPDFPAADWPTGLTGLGFSSIPADFEVKVYRSKVTVDNLATAESVIADPAKQASVSTVRLPVVNLLNTGGGGNYAGDATFPGLTIGTDANDFVVLITSSVVIPTAGEWTFGVNSSDGFNLKLTRGSTTYESSYPEVRGLSETLKVFDVAEAGMYTLRLVCFERNGEASVELYAAPGYWSLFDGSKFRLVGDAAGGGLTVGSIGGDIVTDVSPAMRGVNGSLWVRVPFVLDDPSIFSTLTLRMRYEDGYAAYLNGQVVAKKNAPAGLLWNSTATINRPNNQAANPEDVDISGFASLLRPGLNVLAVHGLNDTAGDADFQVLPELILSSNGLQTRFFAQPTPGAPNAAGMNGVLQPVAFDPPRGFYNQAFPLTLSTSSPAAEIRYTLDGSEPTATAGFVYTGPILIDRTRTVRAAAFQAGYISPVSTTHTYLFVNDIMVQSPQGQPPGPNWPSGPVNGQILDYGMDPDIVNNPRWSSLIDDALLAIPSISLVTDLKHLFDPNTGIYTHAGNDGRAWERPVSMELINP